MNLHVMCTINMDYAYPHVEYVCNKVEHKVYKVPFLCFLLVSFWGGFTFISQN